MSMTHVKRKRNGKNNAEASDSAGDSNPYCIRMHMCTMHEHKAVRKAKRGTGITAKRSRVAKNLKNCQENPNCLFGLGEYSEGIWNENPKVLDNLGSNPKDMRRLPLHDEEISTEAMFPCGLRNLGATCYVNSLLQCLFMNIPFRNAVYEWEPKVPQRMEAAHRKQMQALQRLFARMQLSSLAFVDPQEFASTLALNNVVQQDAHEFTKLLLNHLQSIFIYSKHRSHWNLIDTNFRGLMDYVTTCETCNGQSKRSSSFYELSLNIKGCASVQDSLEAYLAPEYLKNDNQYFCDTCQKKQNARREIQIQGNELPPTLILQLMRFVYDMKTFTKKKVQDFIDIPLTLDVGKMLSCTSESIIYKLVGVLNHRGTTASAGHYTANIFNPMAKEWFAFDDTSVSLLESTDVFSSKESYMLIYSRENSQDISTQVAMPPPAFIDEVNQANKKWLLEITAYERKHVEMVERIATRKQLYKQLFESPLTPEGPFHFVEAELLEVWIQGNDLSTTPEAIQSDLSPYLCQHDKLDPKKACKLKRVPDELYNEMRIQLMSIPLTSENYKCETCLVAYCQETLETHTVHEETQEQLNLLNQSEEDYLISRKWISSWKICRNHSLLKKKPDAKVLQAHEWISTTPINQELVCSHGKLQPGKKALYRFISSALWKLLSSEYKVAAIFSKDVVEDCPDCLNDASNQRVVKNQARLERRQLLSNSPVLVDLYKRKDLLDGLLPQNEPLVLIPGTWMEKWKAYIDNTSASAPICQISAFQCNHGKYVVPIHILDKLQHRKTRGISVEAFVLKLDEWKALSAIYSTLPSLSFFIDNDIVKWGKIDSVGIFVDDPVIRCDECESFQQNELLVVSIDFKNQPIHVIVLREEEEIPLGQQIEIETTSQRRRSNRKSKKYNPEYQVVCNANDSISLLKHRIYEVFHSAPSHQLLYFKGELLDNASTLKNLGIHAHDTIFLKNLTDETAQEIFEIVTNEIEIGFQNSAISSTRRSTISSWVCESCTFINDITFNQCEICNEKRIE